jgi:ribosomal protein S18 acetylase RimI-like enzyme
MANPQQVEAAVLALKAANDSVVAAMPGGVQRTAPHGTSLLFSGGPIGSLNVVLVTAAEPDLDELTALAGQARELAASAGVPWSIRVRGAVPDPRVEALARGYGLGEPSRMPFMLASLGDDVEPPRSDSATLRVRRIGGDEAALYQSMLESGFETPPGVFSIASAEVLEAPRLAAYLAEENGLPVATGWAAFPDDHVSVANISTPPKFRRRGYARAVTTAILREGRAAGARTAFLNSSDMAVPLYESLGFRTVLEWTSFESA